MCCKQSKNIFSSTCPGFAVLLTIFNVGGVNGVSLCQEEGFMKRADVGVVAVTISEKLI